MEDNFFCRNLLIILSEISTIIDRRGFKLQQCSYEKEKTFKG
jgi:hypothetical protein